MLNMYADLIAIAMDSVQSDIPRRSPNRIRPPTGSPAAQSMIKNGLKLIQEEMPLPKSDLDLSSWDERRFSSDSEDSIFSDCENAPKVPEFDFDLDDLEDMTVCSIDDVVTIVAHHTGKSQKRLSRVEL